MALIQITNTTKAISDAETLTTSAVETESVIESINYMLSEIKQYWEQTQQDAQSFSVGLEKNAETLRTIVECNKEFASVITKYAENQEKTGQKTIS